MKNLTKILCALAVVIAMACSKEGPTGPAGTNGTNGTNGNANVLYSDWFNSGSWTASSGNETYYVDKAEAKITQSILDSSVVLAYVKLISDGSNVRALPANTGTSTFWNYTLTVGNIRFTTNLSSAPGDNNQFRYVIIPSSTHLRLKKPLKEMSYDEICALYNIPK